MKVFEEKHSRILLHIVDFNGVQRFEGPNCSFNAASKGPKHWFPLKSTGEKSWNAFLKNLNFFSTEKEFLIF